MYVCMYLYNNIYKEFCVGGSKAKQCYIFHIAPRGVNSSILYDNIEPDTHMAKNHKNFRRFFSASTPMDKIVNVIMQ